MTAHPQDPRTERWTAPLLFAVLGAFFFLARKVNLTFDGSAFLSFFSDPLRVPFLAHLLFAKLFWLCIWLGGAAGLRAETAGYLQSALFMAAAGALWWGFLRRRGVGRAASLLTLLLFATNQSVIENGTSVELYGAAMFTIALSLLAFERVVAKPDRRNTLTLYFSCVLVLAMHVGYCFWVFGVYVALALGEGPLRRRAAWIAWGAATIPGILLWGLAAGAIGRASFGSTGVFFTGYWQAHSFGDVLRLVFNAPLNGFARYAGLILFAAPFGWRAARAAHAPFARLAVVATLAFFAYYSFWVVDLGTFYLPLQFLWGLSAALGIDAVLRSVKGVKLGFGLAAAALYALLFMILPDHAEFSGTHRTVLMLTVAYWVWLVLASLASTIPHRAPPQEGGLSTPPFSPSPSTVALVAFTFLLLHGMAYGPFIVEEKWPDATTRTLRAFEAVAPANARLVTARSAFRVNGQSRREAMPVMEDWWDEKQMEHRRKKIEKWLQESVPPVARPVYFDLESYTKRDFIWGRLGGPGGIGIPYESFKFTQVRSEGDLFFRLDWSPPMDAAPYGLYPAENWGPTPVTWMRREAWIDIQPESSRVGIKYFINTPTASADLPTRVNIEVDDTDHKVSVAHTKEGYYTQTLDLAGLTSPTLRLHITVDPYWISTDGRELGVALYPPEWPK